MRVLRVCRVQIAAECLQRSRVIYGELKERRQTLLNARDRYLAYVYLLQLDARLERLTTGSKYSVYRSYDTIRYEILF